FVVSAVTTAYCFYWDVVMDWGLGNRDVPYFLLRRELYFQPMTYYTAIVLDLVMRLGWAILISPSQTYLQQHLVLLLGCVELLRRFMWAVFRVEWEWIKVKNKLPTAESSLELAEEGEGWGGKGEVSQSDVIAALTAAGDVDAAITEKSPR
ncbi:PHO1-H4, partial [Symbiodinium microadriaticum]